LSPSSKAKSSNRLLGSGAGHAIEDGYILGRALKDHLASQTSSSPRPLSTWMDLYQRVRLPRTQRAQITSRQAGDVYEMQGKLFEGLSYDEGVPVVREKLQSRMKWVWGANIDGDYDQAVIDAGLQS
jgi:salicylate hydroxylase